MAVVVQATLAAALMGLWLHFLPCVWLTCDLGAGDDPQLRVGLGLGGAIFFCMLFVLSACTCDTGLVRYRPMRPRYRRERLRPVDDDY